MTREALATTSLQSQIGTYTRALNGSDAAANDGTSDYRTSEVADSTFTTVTLQNSVLLQDYESQAFPDAVSMSVFLELPDGTPLEFTSLQPGSLARDYRRLLSTTRYTPEVDRSILDTFPALSSQLEAKATVVGYALPTRIALTNEASLRKNAAGLEVWHSEFLQPMWHLAMEDSSSGGASGDSQSGNSVTQANDSDLRRYSSSSRSTKVPSPPGSLQPISSGSPRHFYSVSSRSTTVSSAPVSSHPISSWSPRHFYSIMTNSNPVTDVMYWFRFTDGIDALGAMTSSAFDDGSRKTIEIGYKDTGHRSCNNPLYFMKANFPTNAKVQVDRSEDDTDAVVWLSDLSVIKAHQLLNPNNDYFVSWHGGITNEALIEGGFEPTAFMQDFLTGSPGPYQVQLGHWIVFNNPLATFSDKTFNIISHEQTHRGLPAANDNRDFHLAFDVPWTHNWNFEAGNTDHWRGVSNLLANICCAANAAQGNGYLHVVSTLVPPTDGTWNNTWVHQTFRVRGSGVEGGQLETGDNTGVMFEGYFRCPESSPAGAGHPNSARGCLVAIWVKTVAEPTWTGRYVLEEIPADGQWHHVESLHDLPSMQSDDDLDVYINTYGYRMDMDALWISTDLCGFDGCRDQN